MLTQFFTGKKHLSRRAFFAAALLTIFLIVAAVLPHQHTRNAFNGRAHGAVSIEASSASCPLCDWLSIPHLPAAAAAPMPQIPTADWQPPALPALVCAVGFVTLSDSPQRGPPVTLTGLPTNP